MRTENSCHFFLKSMANKIHWICPSPSYKNC